MKKRLIQVLIIIFAVSTISGCSKDKIDADNLSQNNKTNIKTENENKDLKTKAEELSIADFEELLAQLPVTVVSTKFSIQSDEYKTIYPDLLHAVLKNNTEDDIKDAIVAFVAWDENKLPVKIKGHMDFTDGSYVKLVEYDDINLIPGESFGEDSGFGIDEHINIESFEAIVVSYETFDGSTWENPFYNDWKTLYEGKKLTEDMSVKVLVDQTQNTSDESKDKVINPSESKISEVDLTNQLDSQDVKIIETKYNIQSDEYKTIYPDLLHAVIKNNTEDDIKDAIVAFVAWDENKLPVKIKGHMDFTDGSYVKLVEYDDINLIPGESFGEDSGFGIDEHINIAFFKAIIVSYETFDGSIWENPLYNDWKILYEGKKL